MSQTDEITRHLDDVSRALRAIDLAQIKRICELIEQFARVFVIGNGGSAATAQHFAADLGRFVAAGVFAPFDIPGLTMYANDYGYENSFQLALNRYQPTGNDLLFAISTSGVSESVVFPARCWPGPVVALVGPSSSPLRGVAHVPVVVESRTIEVIEDCHSAICHAIVREFKDAPHGRFKGVDESE